MPSFKLPLSGNVTQQINPWNWFLNTVGGQFGLININLGRSSAPEIEQDILTSVGSYGRQLGKMCAAMRVLVAHMPDNASLSPAEKKDLADLVRMLDNIDDIKASHKK